MASSEGIHSNSINASKTRKQETSYKILGLFLIMAIVLAAWALPLSLLSIVRAQVGNTFINVIPSQITVNATQAEFFNVTVWVYEVTDLFAYQIALQVNDSLVSINRGWLPKWNSSWVFYGEISIGLDPIFYDYDEDGRYEWVMIGDSMLFGDPFTGNGLLAIIELHVERSPATALLNIDNTDPSLPTTDLLDFDLRQIPTARNNGQVKIYTERYPSQITVSVNPAQVNVGEEVVLTGNLSGIREAEIQPIPDTSITFQRKEGVAWVDVGTANTNETGHFRYVWLTDVTGIIPLRGKWDGDESFMGETSDLVTVHVMKPTIESCDVTGLEKQIFTPVESVHVYGDNFDTEESPIIYVVPMGSPYTSTESIYNTSAQADLVGHMDPVNLGRFPQGEYSIWVDRNDNGVFDEEMEPADAFGLATISSEVEDQWIISGNFIKGEKLTLYFTPHHDWSLLPYPDLGEPEYSKHLMVNITNEATGNYTLFRVILTVPREMIPPEPPYNFVLAIYDIEVIHQGAVLVEDDPTKISGTALNDGEFILKCELMPNTVIDKHLVNQSIWIHDASPPPKLVLYSVHPAGFSVIPEYGMGSIIGAGCLAALYTLFKRRHKS